MVEIFESILHLAGGVGKVSSAMMYDSNYMTVDGVTDDGKTYTISLHIKEAESKDEGVL